MGGHPLRLTDQWTLVNRTMMCILESRLAIEIATVDLLSLRGWNLSNVTACPQQTVDSAIGSNVVTSSNDSLRVCETCHVLDVGLKGYFSHVLSGSCELQQIFNLTYKMKCETECSALRAFRYSASQRIKRKRKKFNFRDFYLVWSCMIKLPSMFKSTLSMISVAQL